MPNMYDYLDAEFKVFSLYRIVGGVCECGDEDCMAIGKHPRISNWQLGIPYSDEQLEFMESMGHFSTGFGALCNGWVIIDIDPKNGGNASYEKLKADLNMDFEQKSGFVVATGGGGLHIYFRNPVNEKLRTTLKEYPGIDFKSSGFVVGCGSLHKSGSFYEDKKGSPDEITDAPTELLELLKRTSSDSEFMAGETADAEQIRAMLDAIDPDIDYESWVHIGMAIHDELSGDGFELWDEWSQNGSKYNQKEMDFKWHSFGKSNGRVTIGTLIKIAEDHGYLEPVTFTPTIDTSHINPEDYQKKAEPKEDNEGVEEPVNINSVDLFDAPGLTGDIYRFIDSQCLFPRKRLALGAALAALGTIGALRYEDEVFNVTSNLYIFGVAGSATGKEAVQQAQMEVMRAAGYQNALYGSIKSEQELIRNLVLHQVNTYVIDEFGIFLGKVVNATRRGGASYLEGVIGSLMSIYSKANGVMPIGGDKMEEISAELKKKIAICQKNIDELENVDLNTTIRDSAVSMLEEIHSTGGIKKPFLSLVGYTTPVTFNSLIDYETATNGWVGRALIFNEPDTNPRPYKRNKPDKMSDKLRNKINSIATAGHAEMGYQPRIEFNGETKKVGTTPDAISLLEDITEFLFEYADHHKSTTGLESIVRRTREQILKVSYVLAIGDGLERTVEHVRWAYVLCKRDLDEKLKLANTNVMEQYGHKEETLDFRILLELDGGERKSVREIWVKHRKYKTSEIETVLQKLVKSGVVETDVEKGKGRPKTVFFIKK
ncbi:DNA primase [Vibrio phage pYD21-A]|uniref:DNA primase n=1 Tax=Vibrio phage pYD21-A TaxID=754049 RepID=UPI0002C0476A|nr:DNA primase [Vibrio phage pYD21-A]AGH16094.1 hypothetical protein VPKG_00057 [Vibrio phage pYD21-A]